MANLVENRPTQKPDGISCVGTLLIAVLLLFVLGVGLEGAGADRSQARLAATAASAVGTATRQALAALTLTAQATDTPTATATATATQTSTPSPTMTATATATKSPTHTPSPSPTVGPSPTPTNTAPPPPLPTPNGIYSWTLEVPILMYHYVSNPPEDADIFRTDLSVSPDKFRAQMEYLVANGYSTIDLYDLSLAIVNEGELPPRPVIITLDDGYRDNYENAFPILRELGLTAMFFIVTDFVDQGHPDYMSWDMLKEMAGAGMRLEPHTKTHADLRDQERDFLIWQILGSRETLEAHIGYRPRYFAYPAGRYDEAVIQVLKELDFWGAVATAGGRWHGFNDRYEWTRLRVRYTTTLEEFADLLVE